LGGGQDNSHGHKIVVRWNKYGDNGGVTESDEIVSIYRNQEWTSGQCHIEMLVEIHWTWPWSGWSGISREKESVGKKKIRSFIRGCLRFFADLISEVYISLISSFISLTV